MSDVEDTILKLKMSFCQMHLNGFSGFIQEIFTHGSKVNTFNFKEFQTSAGCP